MFSSKKGPEPAPVREVNPDLAKEREKCTFKTLELTHFLDGGVEKYNERRERGKQ
jgi:acyl-CoA oxidase